MENTQVTAPVVVEKKTPILAEQDGRLTGTTFDEQWRLANVFHKSGMMPQSLNTTEKVLVAIQICHELSLPPMASISKIAVINGTASLFGDLPLALVYRSGKIDWIEESLITDPVTHQTIGARCITKRKGMEKTVERSFMKKDAETAGLLSKGPWKQYPSRMYQMRARSWCIKDAYTDVLSGVAIGEYDHNAIIDHSGNILGLPNKTVADELNEKYASNDTADAGQV